MLQLCYNEWRLTCTPCNRAAIPTVTLVVCHTSRLVVW